MVAAPTDRSVTILLATYDGERFLDAQLASIAAQDVGAIDIVASDDGSTDRTPQILADWAGRWRGGRFSVGSGPRQGHAENFRALAAHGAVATGYVAFADQDDVWSPDKLASAIAQLEAAGPGPAIYFSRTRLVDERLAPLGLSPLFRRPPGFRNAIVQSIGGGNTVVMNRAAFAIFAESARRSPFATHDWWAYIICAGAGARVIYDRVPHIDYRQHGANLVGHNLGLAARLRRVRLLLHGQLTRWTNQNLDALEKCDDLLTAEARRTIADLRRIREVRGLRAIFRLRAAGLYRQTLLGNIGLVVAAALGKI